MNARDEALRAELVRAATPAPYAERMKPRTLIAGAVAIALASALTGGAVSAVTLSGSETEAPSEITSADISAVTARGLELVGTHAELFGTPFIVSGRGNVVVELGPVPEGASSVAFSLTCVSEGKIGVAVNGSPQNAWVECEDDDGDGSYGGFGTFIDQVTDAENTITLESTANLVLWASWAKQAELPAQSQAQLDALADGTVTAEEYDAGFERFASCMAEAGHPLVFIDKSRTVYNYSLTDESVSTGTDVQCYDAEFKDIDIAWQIANEDASESTEILRDCLREHRIEPAYPTEEVVRQLDEAGIDVARDCMGA